MLKMWNTWRKFKSKGDAIFVELFINYLFWFFYPQKIKAEGHNELWNIFLFSLRKAKHVVLLNTALLVDIFILKAGGQENELFIEVILVYPGNDGFICIYIFVYIYIFMTVNKFRHILFASWQKYGKCWVFIIVKQGERPFHEIYWHWKSVFKLCLNNKKY